MALNRLRDTLLNHVMHGGKTEARALQSHFADLMIDPSSVSPHIPFELSDSLRRCIEDNDVVNRVYETVDCVLTLKNTPEEIWEELKNLSAIYAERGRRFRISKLNDGSTLRDCYRVVTYMRVQGMIPDVAAFFQDIEERYSEMGIRAYAHNEYLLLAADLYSDLFTLWGYAEDLKEMLGVRSSRYVLRAAEGGSYA